MLGQLITRRSDWPANLYMSGTVFPSAQKKKQECLGHKLPNCESLVQAQAKFHGSYLQAGIPHRYSPANLNSAFGTRANMTKNTGRLSFGAGFRAGSWSDGWVQAVAGGLAGRAQGRVRTWVAAGCGLQVAAAGVIFVFNP